MSYSNLIVEEGDFNTFEMCEERPAPKVEIEIVKHNTKCKLQALAVIVIGCFFTTWLILDYTVLRQPIVEVPNNHSHNKDFLPESNKLIRFHSDSNDTKSHQKQVVEEETSLEEEITSWFTLGDNADTLTNPECIIQIQISSDKLTNSVKCSTPTGQECIYPYAQIGNLTHSRLEEDMMKESGYVWLLRSSIYIKEFHATYPIKIAMKSFTKLVRSVKNEVYSLLSLNRNKFSATGSTKFHYNFSDDNGIDAINLEPHYENLIKNLPELNQSTRSELESSFMAVIDNEWEIGLMNDVLGLEDIQINGSLGYGVVDPWPRPNEIWITGIEYKVGEYDYGIEQMVRGFQEYDHQRYRLCWCQHDSSISYNVHPEEILTFSPKCFEPIDKSMPSFFKKRPELKDSRISKTLYCV